MRNNVAPGTSALTGNHQPTYQATLNWDVLESQYKN
jgi:hypothetical protein